jgi:hypothetical protein
MSMGRADERQVEGEPEEARGALASTMMQSQLTLAEFMVEDWWPRFAMVRDSADTRERNLGELEDQPRVPAAEAIRQARERVAAGERTRAANA